MKIKQKKRLQKKLIIVIIVILSLLIGSLIYVYYFKGNLFGWKALTTVQSNIDYGPATPEQKQAGTRSKSGSTDKPPAPTTIPGSDKKNVQITITAANQNGSTVQIRTLIGAVEDTGTCTLTMTSSERPPVTKTATSQAMAVTSTCQGFDVPTSELSAGPWNIQVEYDSPALTGSATQDIVIK